MEFVPSSVYTVDPTEGVLYARHDVKEVMPTDTVRVDEPSRYMGLRALDLAVFGHRLDASGVSPLDLLVVDHNNDDSLLVPVEAMMDEPEQYVTKEFARKIITLSDREVMQFGVPVSVLEEIDNQFPGLKPYRKNQRK